jgi:uncharacterized membrane protein
MSENTPVELIVAAFNDENSAKEALKELKAAKHAGLIKIDDAAVLRRDEKNKLHIKEVHDMGGGKGAVLGGALGAAIGLLAGPVGLAVGAGALIGGVAAKYHDGGLSDKRLQAIGNSLKPGTSAIVAIIEHKWVDEVEAIMAEQEADVITQALAADIAAQLNEGHDLAISAVSTDEALSIERTVVGDDMVEVDSALITDEGFAAEQIVATEDAVTMASVTATADAIVTEAAVVTEDGFAAERTIETADGILDEIVAATDDVAIDSVTLITDEGAAQITAVAMADEEEEAEDDSDSADEATA